MLNKYNKYDDYQTFINKFDDANKIKVYNFINNLTQVEKEEFCKLLFSISDIKNVNNIRNSNFVKKIEDFTPSSMFGAGEFLFHVVIKDTKRTTEDLEINSNNFNVKKVTEYKDPIRPGKDGFASNFRFWNSCILPIIRSLYNDNFDNFIVEGYENIDEYIKKYFTDNTKYQKITGPGEFNMKDMSMLRQFLFNIKIRNYDVKNFDKDIENSVKKFTNSEYNIILITNNDIYIGGEYEYAHITQGRVRARLKLC